MNSEKKLYTISRSFIVDEGNGHNRAGIKPEIRFEATPKEAKEFFQNLYRSEFIRHYEDGSLFDGDIGDLEEALNDSECAHTLRYRDDDELYIVYIEETFILNLSSKDYLTETEILKKTEEMNAEYRAFAEQKGFDLDEL